MTAQQRLLSLTSRRHLGTAGVWFLVITGAAALVFGSYWFGRKAA